MKKITGLLKKCLAVALMLMLSEQQNAALTVTLDEVDMVFYNLSSTEEQQRLAAMTLDEAYHILSCETEGQQNGIVVDRKTNETTIKKIKKRKEAQLQAELDENNKKSIQCAEQIANRMRLEGEDLILFDESCDENSLELGTLLQKIMELRMAADKALKYLLK